MTGERYRPSSTQHSARSPPPPASSDPSLTSAPHPNGLGSMPAEQLGRAPAVRSRIPPLWRGGKVKDQDRAPLRRGRRGRPSIGRGPVGPVRMRYGVAVGRGGSVGRGCSRRTGAAARGPSESRAPHPSERSQSDESRDRARKSRVTSESSGPWRRRAHRAVRRAQGRFRKD